MPLRDAFNQVKHKLEDLNRQHNIIPFGQNQNQNQHQQQQAQYPQQGYQQQGYPGQQYQQRYPLQQQYYPPPQQGQHQQWGQPPPQQQYYPPPQQGYSNPQQQHSDRPPPPVPMHSRPSDIGGQHHQQPPPPADSSCPAPPALSAPGTYWHPVFSPSNPVSTEWHHEQGNGNNGWGNAELENYTNSPQNSFHTPDAKLVLRALSDPDHPDPAQRYTSARLVSRHTLQRHRGVLTTWLSLPCAAGIWPAFWLLPKEPMTWPHDGEVDIAESWNGDCENHSCLHWGFYNAEDHNKHLVKATKIPDMHTGRAIRYDFAWDCASTGGKAPGRFMWYIDGRPVMKNMMPEGTRNIDDWCIIINVAMGGNVCQGKTPAKGQYDMVVHDVKMCEEPEGGGWSKFEQDWYHCPDGGLM